MAQLLKLADSQYKIDIDKDWYKAENCYISSYGNDGQIVAILCNHKIISDAKVSAFLKFVQRQKKVINGIKFIWAIQEDVDFSIKIVNEQEIVVVTENSLLDGLVDFSDYKRDIQRRFAENQIYEGYGLTINDVYVEPKCTVYDIEKKENEEILSIENYVAEWLNDEMQHKQLALLGEYGQGKSVLSLRLAYQILNGQIKTKRIPIIIELRGRYIKQYNDTKEILNSWANRYDISPKALLKLHNAGKLLLIFEGFDELELIGDEQIRKEHFRKLWEYSIPKSKIIITGRPNYFMDDNEMMTLLRLSQRQADGSKYCETVNLTPFRREQIISAMRNVKQNVQEEIIKVYDEQSEDSSFRDLVSRPSLLFLTGMIWEGQDLASKISNINSAEVIKAFLSYSYKRQDDRGTETVMNSDERAYFMQGIAIAMTARNGYTNQIEAKELNNVIEMLFQSFPDEITKQIVNSDKKMLKNRLNKQHLLQAISTDIRSCGVLVKDLSAEDTFCFAHKSFLEVLVADFIAESYVVRKDTLFYKTPRYKVLMALINTLRIDPEYLYKDNKNIFKFVIELLSSRIRLKGEDNSKERVKSIYYQLHLYPRGVSLRMLGVIIFLFGPSSKNLFLFMGLLAVFTGCYGLALSGGWDMIFMGFYIFVGVLMIASTNIRLFRLLKDKKRMPLTSIYYGINRIYKIKVVRLFLVCRNLKSELALKHFWPSFVYKMVEYLANNDESVVLHHESA